MTRSLSLGCAMALVFSLAGACSSEPPSQPATTPMAGSQASTAGSAGASGSDSGSGGAAGGNAAVAGNATQAGMTSAAGAAGGGGQPTSAGSGTGGGGGMAMAGAGGGGSGTLPPQGPFACSMYIGAYLSMEWWNTNQFEGKAGDAGKVDSDKWELKWHHHAHISEWRKADSPFWANTGNPMDDAQGAPIQSPCTVNPDKPDRVVFLAIDWELLTEKEWEDGLTESVKNIKTKIPSAKRVDIVTLVRCPNNMMCNPTAMPGPGANDSAPLQDCVVPKAADDAIAKVIAADPGYVAAGPKLEMAACNPAHDGAHMTAEGNQKAAKDYAAYYLQHP